jgi:hypothetical protein
VGAHDHHVQAREPRVAEARPRLDHRGVEVGDFVASRIKRVVQQERCHRTLMGGQRVR